MAFFFAIELLRGKAVLIIFLHLPKENIYFRKVSSKMKESERHTSEFLFFKLNQCLFIFPGLPFLVCQRSVLVDTNDLRYDGFPGS